MAFSPLLNRAQVAIHCLNLVVIDRRANENAPTAHFFIALLDRITPHVDDPVMLGEIKRAVSAARLSSDAYHVKVDVAIGWAVARKDLFPHSPLTVKHLGAVQATVATPERSIEDLTNSHPPDRREAFARNLNKKREDHGWTVEKLAEQVRLEKSTVQNHVAGKFLPHQKNQKKYADVFDVKVSELFD